MKLHSECLQIVRLYVLLEFSYGSDEIWIISECYPELF